MEIYEKEMIIRNTIAGEFPINIECKGKKISLFLTQPTFRQILNSQYIYLESLEEGKSSDCIPQSEIILHLFSQGKWSENEEKLYNNLPKEIENFKVGLYKLVFKSEERKKVRKALNIARAKLQELTEKRMAWDHLTIEGSALISKNRYLFGCGLCYSTGEKLFCGNNFDEGPYELLELAMDQWNKIRPKDEEYREIARTEPWQTIWACRKASNGVFPKSAIELTDEQKNLIRWSMLYDSIYEHPESPAQPIIEDDDMLDGWLIDQRRKREGEKNKSQGESLLTNEKIRNADEVYIPAETLDDARRVNDLNDEGAKRTLKQRFDSIRKKGVVNELDLPDVKVRLRQEVAQKISQDIKNKTK